MLACQCQNFWPMALWQNFKGSASKFGQPLAGCKSLVKRVKRSSTTIKLTSAVSYQEYNEVVTSYFQSALLTHHFQEC